MAILTYNIFPFIQNQLLQSHHEVVGAVVPDRERKRERKKEIEIKIETAIMVKKNIGSLYMGNKTQK